MSIVGAALLLSCSSVHPSPDAEPSKAAYTFRISGEFSTSYDPMTRAALAQGTEAVSDLWVLDYVNGTCVHSEHQVSTQEGFGTVQMSLSYGHHDLCFVASRGTVPVLSDRALAWQKVLDTFTCGCAIDVTPSSGGGREVELKRAVSGVAVQNTDAVPSNAKRMEVTLSDRYEVLALPSLTGSGGAAYTNTFSLAQAVAGTRNIQFNTYTLCPSDDVFTTDVTVRVIANDNSVMSEFTIEGVELLRNRRTILKGDCFMRSGSFSVGIDDAWLEESTMNF